MSATPVPTRDISPPVATSTLALPTATPSSGTDGSTTTVQSIPTPVATSKPRVKFTVEPDPAPTHQTGLDSVSDSVSSLFIAGCRAPVSYVRGFCYWVTHLA